MFKTRDLRTPKLSVRSAAGNLGVILELGMQEFLRITASHMTEEDFGIPLGIFTEFPTFLGSRNIESKAFHTLSHLLFFVFLKMWSLPHQKIVLHPIFTPSDETLTLFWLE